MTEHYVRAVGHPLNENRLAGFRIEPPPRWIASIRPSAAYQSGGPVNQPRQWPARAVLPAELSMSCGPSAGLEMGWRASRVQVTEFGGKGRSASCRRISAARKNEPVMQTRSSGSATRWMASQARPAWRRSQWLAIPSPPAPLPSGEGRPRWRRHVDAAPTRPPTPATARAERRGDSSVSGEHHVIKPARATARASRAGPSLASSQRSAIAAGPKSSRPGP